MGTKPRFCVNLGANVLFISSENTTLYVIQTTEGRKTSVEPKAKNLVYIHFMFPRFFANALNDKMF